MTRSTQRPLNVLTWHIHGSYLYYLLHAPLEFYIPVKTGRPESYGGLPKGSSYTWPSNAHEIPAEEVSGADIDVIVFQSRRNYLVDQFEILTEEQRSLPRLYLEHDPPRISPTETRHIVDDPNMTLVHVTHFNKLMWNNNRTPAIVIDHGVTVPEGVRYSGELNKGIAVVNNLLSRGRRLGADIFEQVRGQVPLDLVGMNSTEAGGLGEVPHSQLLELEARYRFFFNPIRYTSLGLSVCEAMMAGIPVIGLATTEMVTVIENGVSGYLHTDPDQLVSSMQSLISDPAEAQRLGEGARQTALERFNIQRFGQDWEKAILAADAKGPSEPALPNTLLSNVMETSYTSFSLPFTHDTTMTTLLNAGGESMRKPGNE